MKLSQNIKFIIKKIVKKRLSLLLVNLQKKNPLQIISNFQRMLTKMMMIFSNNKQFYLILRQWMMKKTQRKKVRRKYRGEIKAKKKA